MDEEQQIFKVNDDQEDIAFRFEKYNLFSAAVIDENRRLVGSLTIDDVVDIIQDEATEEILPSLCLSSRSIYITVVI